jgi:hypothetical protein
MLSMIGTGKDDTFHFRSIALFLRYQITYLRLRKNPQNSINQVTKIEVLKIGKVPLNTNNKGLVSKLFDLMDVTAESLSSAVESRDVNYIKSNGGVEGTKDPNCG